MSINRDLIRDLPESTLREIYVDRIVSLIRQRYLANDENALLRKKLANLDTDNEFEAYNSYVEECKRQAHIEVYGS